MSAATRRAKRAAAKVEWDELIRVRMRMGCGCCSQIGLFRSLDSAVSAYARAGEQRYASIVDDAGQRFDREIDTRFRPEVE